MTDARELMAARVAAPRPGLRERKKMQAMGRIQDIALDLFEERGFDAVTIEEIAEAAEVSARSIYRYFQTKEGLVLRDAFDDQFLRLLPAFLDETDLRTAMRRAIQQFAEGFGGPELDVAIEQSTRRLRIWMTTPSIRIAAFGLADEMARDVAAAMVAAKVPDRTPADCHVEAAAMVFGLFAALEEWYEAGADEDIFVVVERVMDVLDG